MTSIALWVQVIWKKITNKQQQKNLYFDVKRLTEEYIETDRIIESDEEIQ